MNSVILNMPFCECPKWFKKRVMRIIFRKIRGDGFDPLRSKFLFHHQQTPADPFNEIASVEWTNEQT